MRRFYLIGLVVLALALMRPSFSTAADISCVSSYGARATDESYLAFVAKAYPSGRRPNHDTCSAILIAGPIVSGDAATFADFVRRNRLFLHTVILWSSGGSVEEAIRIGHIIRKNLLSTDAPNYVHDNYHPGLGLLRILVKISPLEQPVYCYGYDCNCASPCFLIWAAGYTRSGSTLGLHRPTSTSTTFSNMPPDRASVLYRQRISDIDRYLTEMEVPRRFIDMMVNTDSNDIRWLSLGEALELYDVPSIEEWIGASCGKLTKAEEEASVEEIGKDWSRRDKKLQKKKKVISDCRRLKIRMARDAIN